MKSEGLPAGMAPAAPPRWTGPLSHGLPLFSKPVPSSFSPSALPSHYHNSPSHHFDVLHIFIYLFFIFVLQFVTQVDTLGHVR